ncbi:MAG TPA: hypothetical protein VKT80_03715 [Chloroflexota bacterium]|nr:hypothetical protein [Chloroflexota bacterium]
MTSGLEATKICIECGETRPVDEFPFVAPDRSRRNTRCRSCLRSTRPAPRLSAEVADDTIGFVVEVTDALPSTRFVDELEVVDACWANCVEVGPPGIRRMFDRLDNAAADLAESPNERLKIRDLVREFRAGSVALQQAHRVVRAVLAELMKTESVSAQKS